MIRWRLQHNHQRFLPRLRNLPQGHGHVRRAGDQRRRLRPQGPRPAAQQHLDQHRLQIREVPRHGIAAILEQRGSGGILFNFGLFIIYTHR